MAISREEVPEGKNEDNKTQTLLREDQSCDWLNRNIISFINPCLKVRKKCNPVREKKTQ